MLHSSVHTNYSKKSTISRRSSDRANLKDKNGNDSLFSLEIKRPVFASKRFIRPPSMEDPVIYSSAHHNTIKHVSADWAGVMKEQEKYQTMGKKGGPQVLKAQKPTPDFRAGFDCDRWCAERLYSKVMSAPARSP